MRNTVRGHCGGIIFYCGDNCIFGNAAEKMLQDVSNQLDIHEGAFCKVHIDCMEGRAIEVPVLTIMMMRVCDIIITGLSDEFSIRDAIHRLLVKPCYYESPNDKPKSKNCFS